jgi:hypothetical protein
MTLVLTIIALLGLILFVVGGLLWLFSVPRRATATTLGLAGLLVWAVATIILTIMALV